MLISFYSVSSSKLFTILIDASTLIVSGSFCTVVGVLVIAHALSGSLRKSGPACQPLLISMSIGLLPRVNQSAMLFLLPVQYKSFFFRYLLEFLLRMLRRIHSISYFARFLLERFIV